jgi:sugar phosphate isomerase/epimerase
MTTPTIDLSICWGFGETTPEEGLPRLREYGFEGIELWPDLLGKFGTERWAAALRATGLTCFQLCPYFNFMEGEPKIEASRRMLEEFLQAAKAVGCRRLRVFTGPPWGQGVVGAHEATEQQWQDAILGLQEFCDRSAQQGVELCLECHEGSLMEDSPNALRLIRAVGRPNLTANLQLPLRNEDWQTSLQQMAPHTAHIHIHNWTQGLGAGDLTFLGEGAFDWLPVVRHIAVGCGRRLCLSAEHINHGGRHDPWETARRDGPALRALRERVGATPGADADPRPRRSAPRG